MPAHAPTPPMGWNSWDCYGSSVTEAEVIANAEFMAAHLAQFGWDTVVVDIDWADPAPSAHEYNVGAALAMDEWGRLVPDPGRFPSAAGGAGFAPLAARIHAMGLRFGIHTMRGVPRIAVDAKTPVLGAAGVTAADIADPGNACEWNPDNVGLDHSHPGARAYYDSCLELYASWGVDFIKTDDMLWPYQAAEIEAYSRALDATGRPMQLSLSPGRDLSLAHLPHLREHATMWRVSDDLWDDWDAVLQNFVRLARWAPHADDAGWPDGDMLPLGRIGIRAHVGEPRDDRLSSAERRSLMTLWVMARSPLMIGGDLPSTDPETIALFTNADVLDVLRESSRNREVVREGDLVLWAADGPAGVRYAAAFNLADDARRVAVDAAGVGFPPRPDGTVTELWSGADVGSRHVVAQDDEARGVAPGSTALFLDLDGHGAALLRFTPRSSASL